jgi:hypothetical protein
MSSSFALYKYIYLTQQIIYKGKLEGLGFQRAFQQNKDWIPEALVNSTLN